MAETSLGEGELHGREKTAGFGLKRLGNLRVRRKWQRRGHGSNGFRGVLEISTSAKTISEWPRLQSLVVSLSCS